jgi:hypothetical protein
MWRIKAYDAHCLTHHWHTFETYVNEAQDSRDVREQVKERFSNLWGCKISAFGCYTVTPVLPTIMPAGVGRKD